MRRGALTVEDLEGLVPGAARVDDQRKITLVRQLNLGGEHVALLSAGRVLVVIVEARLPHGDDLGEIQ